MCFILKTQAFIGTTFAQTGKSVRFSERSHKRIILNLKNLYAND